MELYSEYFGEGRKATVCRIQRGLDRQFDVWEVALYIDNKVIQRVTLQKEQEAENFAESFCQGADGNQVLLNEVMNG
jgi:hypothetical protein